MARGRLEEITTSTHVVLPVVHVVDEDQTLRNVQIAHDAGADGVWIIDHDGDGRNTLRCAGAARDWFPDLWIGVNLLGERPQTAYRHLPGWVDGLWCDDACVDERGGEQVVPDLVDAARGEAANGNAMYFGGVAFKYRRPVADLEGAARVAAGRVDVVTTSGVGTGHAADLEKLERMREGCGDAPLAVASGITPANVREYLGLVDAFLVATGISKDFHHLDPALTRALVEAVRG